MRLEELLLLVVQLPHAVVDLYGGARSVRIINTTQDEVMVVLFVWEGLSLGKSPTSRALQIIFSLFLSAMQRCSGGDR